MKLNELAHEIAGTKKMLDQMEAQYKALCAKYLKRGGETVLLEDLGVKINVVNPENTEFNTLALIRHMIKQNKVKQLAASVNVVSSRLVENTDKVFAAKVVEKFSTKVSGQPYVKVMAA